MSPPLTLPPPPLLPPPPSSTLPNSRPSSPARSSSAPPRARHRRSISDVGARTEKALSASLSSLPPRTSEQNKTNALLDENTLPHLPFVAGAFASKPATSAHLRSSLPAATRYHHSSRPAPAPRAYQTPVRRGASVKINEKALPTKESILRRSNSSGAAALSRRFAENMGMLGKFDVKARQWNAPGGVTRLEDDQARPTKYPKHSPPSSSGASVAPAANATTGSAGSSMSEAELRHQEAVERLRLARTNDLSQSHRALSDADMDVDFEGDRDEIMSSVNGRDVRPPMGGASDGGRSPRSEGHNGWDDETLRQKTQEMAELQHRVEVLRRSEQMQPVPPAPSSLPRPPGAPGSFSVGHGRPFGSTASGPTLPAPSGRSAPGGRGAFPAGTAPPPLPPNSAPSAFRPPPFGRPSPRDSPPHPQTYEAAMQLYHAERNVRERVEAHCHRLENRLHEVELKLSESEAEARGLRHRAETLEEDLESLNGKMDVSRESLQRSHSVGAGGRMRVPEVVTPRSEEWDERNLATQQRQHEEAARKARAVQTLQARNIGAAGPAPLGGRPSGVGARPRTASLGGRPPVGLGGPGGPVGGQGKPYFRPPLPRHAPGGPAPHPHHSGPPQARGRPASVGGPARPALSGGGGVNVYNQDIYGSQHAGPA